MRIQHNILAMNAYRNYNNNTSALGKNLEKLSSGYKINRAGDDAAGLAISEKMRAQITGLDAAQKNVKDGISLVKTAEGAMQEIQDMLNRMDYLATQSANGTYDNEVDRNNLQKEVEALKSEINRIADSANFNGIKLLDGSKSDTASTSKITGLSRMISEVIGDDDYTVTEAGNKTILDTNAKTPKEGAFKISLAGLKFTTASASGTVSISFQLGDVEFTATATIAAGDDDAAIKAKLADAIASAVKAQCAGGASSTAKINNVDWGVSTGTTDVTFTQKKKPMTAAEAQTNFDFKITSVTFSTSSGAEVSSLNGAVSTGTITTQKGEPIDAAHKANTIFKMTEADIKDGTVVTIGKKSVVLKVGPESTVKAGNHTLVDLSTMDPEKIDLNAALSAISKAFGGSVQATTKGPDGTDITGNFAVGFSDGTNGDKFAGLTVSRTDDINGTTVKAAWTTKEKVGELFSLELNKPAGEALGLQIGDTSDSFNQMKINIGDMHTYAMGSGGMNTIENIDISTQDGAAAAVQVIRDAINYVSGVRGDLGAFQNRLEHTQNNLAVMAENIQDAESTIRDTDVANEMMSYVKNNILVQSAQAMLAQANQVPQGVLQLLG